MRVGGKIFIKVNSVQYKAKGSFTYNIGSDKREGVVGSDGVHGFKVTPQISMLEGVITDSGDLSLKDLTNIEDASITLELANGKVIAFENAWFAGDGNVTTEEGEIAAKFEAESAEEIR